LTKGNGQGLAYRRELTLQERRNVLWECR